MKKRFRFASVPILLLALLVLTVVILSLVKSDQETEEGSLRMLYNGEVTSLNYLTTSSTTDFSLSANIIDTLVEYDKYGQVQPSLAESWSVSDDGLVWTFSLRRDAAWVDYTGAYVADVTAGDFVSAAQYILDSRNASGTADVFCSVIDGAEEYYNSTVPAAEGETAPEAVDFKTVGIRAVDDYTLEYTLSNPCPYFESMLTYVCFMPVYGPFLAEKGEAFGIADGPESVLYCGAYRLAEFHPQESRLLVKNESNWDADQVHIVKIEYIYNAEATTISAEMYLRGEVDCASITNTTAAEWLSSPETESLIRPVRQTGFYSYFWSFNFDAKFDEEYEPDNWNLAVKNEAFRQSFYYGLDRVKAKLCVEPYHPESIIFNTVTPPDFVSVSGVDYTELGGLAAITELGTDTCNEAKALAYKAQAVEELTAAGVTFPVKVLVKYNPSSTTWANECMVVEQQLEGLLGTDYIDIIVEAGPSTGFLKEVRKSGGYAFMKCNWGPDYADPQTYTDPFDVGNSYNFMDVGANESEMEEYYGLTEEAKSIVNDIEARYTAFAEAEAYLINRAYIIPYGYDRGGYDASRVNTFTCQYAPFGISNNRYKGAELVSEPMSTELYFEAYEKWLRERAEGGKS